MKRQSIVQYASALFALLLVYAASSKLMGYTDFKIELGKSPILGLYAGYIAWLIPVLEIGIALLLSFEKLRMPGLLLFVGIMAMFTAYIIMILNYSAYIPCTCGGILEKMTWKEHLIFNIAFVVIGVLMVLISPANDNVIIKPDRKLLQ